MKRSLPASRRAAMLAAVLLLIGATVWMSRRRQEAAPTPRQPEAAATSAGQRPAPLVVTKLSDERASRPHPLQAAKEPPAAAEEVDGPAGPFDPLSEALEASLRAREEKAFEKLPAGAMESIVAELENELREKGGLYAYNSRAYGATIEAGWVDFAANYSLKKIGSPGLSYALESVKVGDRVIAEGGVAEPQVRAEKRSVWFARGPAVEEEYALRPEAMEQSFIVKELPGGPGAITVTGRVSTNLAPPVDGPRGASLAFTHGGKGLVTMSEAVAIDAAGRRQSLELAYAGGKVSITVPAEWVASATLPIVVDPLVGSAFSVYSTTDPNTNYNVGNHPVRMMDCAYSPTNATWFVVWTERWGTGQANGFDYDVRARRVTAAGVVTGGTVGIDTSTRGSYEPCIAYSAAGPPPNDRYLIAFRVDPTNNLSDTDQRIDAKIHGGDGVFVTISPFTLESAAGQDFAPSAAYDGAQWYVTWTNKVNSSNHNIRGRFVGNGGTLGALVHPDTDADYAAAPSVAFANGAYLVAWEKGTSSVRGISARTMLPSGSFPTSITSVEPSGSAPREPDVAGGGATWFVVWRNNGNQDIEGRVANAGTGGTLSFATSTFDVQTGATTRQLPRAAYSVTDGAYLAVYGEGVGAAANVKGHKVTPAGVVTAAELIAGTATQEWRPELAWNSATNEFLVTYTFGGGNPSFEVRAQRVNLGSVGSPPPAPSGFNGVALTPTSIQWTWTDVAGETGYEVRDAAHLVKGIVGAGVTSFTESIGLTENVAYNRHVNAFNAAGASPDSNAVAKYTKVHDPVAGDFTVTAVHTSRIDVAVTAAKRPE